MSLLAREYFQVTDSKTCLPLQEASALFVVAGSGNITVEGGAQTEVHPGQAFLVPARLQLRLEAEGELTVYRTCLGS